MDIIDLDKSPIPDIKYEDEPALEQQISSINNTIPDTNRYINIYPDIYTSQEHNGTETKQPFIYIRIISRISHRSPFIRQVLEFDIEQSYIKFNGYYYVENANEKSKDYGFNLLPQIVIIVYRGLENELDNHRKYYVSEIYHKEVIEDTSVYSYDQDEELKICCFPTAIIKLQFRILEIYDKLDIAKKRMNEL